MKDYENDPNVNKSIDELLDLLGKILFLPIDIGLSCLCLDEQDPLVEQTENSLFLLEEETKPADALQANNARRNTHLEARPVLVV